tara:strand:+ start:341 stop:556 length:216 start_codon:yes stop_codon:yes gene_type:complete
VTKEFVCVVVVEVEVVPVLVEVLVEVVTVVGGVVTVEYVLQQDVTKSQILDVREAAAPDTIVSLNSHPVPM